MPKQMKTVESLSAVPSAQKDTAVDPKPGSRRRRPARVPIAQPMAKPKRPSKSSAIAPKEASGTKPARAPAPSMPRRGAVDGPSKPVRRTGESAPKRPSALDAAARVLAGLKGAEAKDGIAAPDLIERMAKAKLWMSPGGQTPAATLYAAMVREITAKGKASRFVRVSPGRFRAAPRTGAKSS